jgi:hypothetical protein
MIQPRGLAVDRSVFMAEIMLDNSGVRVDEMDPDVGVTDAISWFATAVSIILCGGITSQELPRKRRRIIGINGSKRFMPPP